MRIAMIVLGIVLVLLLLMVLWFLNCRRRLETVSARVRQAWEEVEAALIQRHWQAAALTKVVDSQYALSKATREQLDRVIVRASQPGEPMVRARWEDKLTQALDAVAADGEAAGVTSSEEYRSVRKELGRVDDAVAAARRYYNSLVPEFNVLCSGWLRKRAARYYGYDSVQYFLPGEPLPSVSDLNEPDARYRQ